MTSRRRTVEHQRQLCLRDWERASDALVDVGILTPGKRKQLQRLLMHEVERVHADRRALAELLTVILRAMVAGTIQDPVQFRRGEGGVVALHPESLYEALAPSHPELASPNEMRSLLRAGRQFAPDVVLVAAQRIPFGARLGRRRGALISEAHAHAFALTAR